MSNLLEIKGLTVELQQAPYHIPLVNNIDVTVPENKIAGLVGESGSGKTLTAHSILQLHQSSRIRISSGKILFSNQDLLKSSAKEMLKIAGNQISMIFQDPMTSLNPLIKLGKQLDEMLKIHQSIPASERKQNIISLLKQVGFPDPEKRLRQYPHQLSGGLQQRVMIAMALLNHPRLLIADEPTTALDVTTQAQILKLLQQLQQQFQLSILFISHDLLLISKITDTVHIMYAGEIVESGETRKIFETPFHPYTQGLMDALPLVDQSTKEKIVKPIPGNIPNPQNRPNGCIFSDRCPKAQNKCFSEIPEITVHMKAHAYKCFYPLNNK